MSERKPTCKFLRDTAAVDLQLGLNFVSCSTLVCESVEAFHACDRGSISLVRIWVWSFFGAEAEFLWVP